MFFKRRPKTDPIAAKLRESTGPVGPHMTPEEIEKRKTLAKQRRPSPMEQIDNLAVRNAKEAQSHPLSSYEVIEMMDDCHPAVLDFIRALGYDPDTLEKMVIHIKAGSPIKVEATGFAVASRSVGSTVDINDLYLQRP